MKPLQLLVRGGALALFACALTGCVDEDRSDCPPPGPVENTVSILYEVHLEQASDEFTGTLNTLHAGFWSQPASLTWHRCIPQAEMPGNRYQVTLPLDNYSHLGVVNYPSDGCMQDESPCAGVLTDSELRLHDDGQGNLSAIYNEVYAGRISVTVDEESRTYRVPLYPCVGKVRIHVKHPASMTGVRAYMEGMAVCFTPDDSCYEYNSGLTLDVNNAALCSHTGIQSDFEYFCFPTPAEPLRNKAAGDATYYWKAIFLVDEGGQTNRYTYYVSDSQVRPGQLTEVTFDLGNVEAATGVVVDMDWKPGHEFDPEI